jgi:hypothetical protein
MTDIQEFFFTDLIEFMVDDGKPVGYSRGRGRIRNHGRRRCNGPEEGPGDIRRVESTLIPAHSIHSIGVDEAWFDSYVFVPYGGRVNIHAAGRCQ